MTLCVGDTISKIHYEKDGKSTLTTGEGHRIFKVVKIDYFRGEQLISVEVIE